MAVHDYATSMNSLRCYLFAEADEAGSSPLLKVRVFLSFYAVFYRFMLYFYRCMLFLC